MGPSAGLTSQDISFLPDLSPEFGTLIVFLCFQAGVLFFCSALLGVLSRRVGPNYLICHHQKLPSLCLNLFLTSFSKAKNSILKFLFSYTINNFSNF